MGTKTQFKITDFGDKRMESYIALDNSEYLIIFF